MTATLGSPGSHNSAERDGAYWETKTFRYDCIHDRLHLILAHIRDRQPARVLDLGCSTGRLGDAVAQLCPQTEYYGCDLSQAAVDQIARPNVIQWDLNAQGLPFAEVSFDCVVASGICEYLDDLPTAFNELRQRVTPTGTLLVTYVNAHHIGRLARRLVGRGSAGNPTWRRLTSLKGFRHHLAGAGFQVERQWITHGRIQEVPREGSSPHVDIWRRFCQRTQFLTSLFAQQVIYLCRPAK